ncbi:MAG: hypothetical protein IT319_09145 [Anaerolineae bacterium]|nr:hypothetical protein [Anaerolineae bacterium]
MIAEQEILDQIRALDAEGRRQVLEFARSLSHPKGISGKEFLERTRNSRANLADLELMEQAIEEEFERVDPDAWDLPT